MKKFFRSMTMHLLLATLLVVFGIGLIIAAFAVPPAGVIDPTVLAAYGETLTFAGALLGIDYRYRYSRQSGNRPTDNSPSNPHHDDNPPIDS